MTLLATLCFSVYHYVIVTCGHIGCCSVKSAALACIFIAASLSFPYCVALWEDSVQVCERTTYAKPALDLYVV